LKSFDTKNSKFCYQKVVKVTTLFACCFLGYSLPFLTQTERKV